LDIAVKAWEKLVGDGVQVRLVSMPCVEWFDEQDEAYRASVLPREIKARVVVEAGIRQCWDRFLGENGRFVGMSSYGASAPYSDLYKHFGITPEHVAAEVKAALGK
jgi:transketolase